MNPHTLFIGLALVSIAVTALQMFVSGNYAGLYEMGRILGIAGVCIAVVLFFTRKYWRNARRIV